MRREPKKEEEGQDAARRGHTLSVRALLFAAILLAGAPGVVFGAMLAWNAYQLTSRQEAMVRTDEAERASVRIDEALRSARERTASYAVGLAIRRSPRECASVFAAVLETQTLINAIARADAQGRITCATTPRALGANVGEAEWFLALKNGAAESVSRLAPTPLEAEPSVIVAHRVEDGGRFQGAAFASVPRSQFDAALSKDVEGRSGGAVLFDAGGALVAQRVGNLSAQDALAAGRAALAAPSLRATQSGVIAQAARNSPAGFTVLSVAPQARQNELGLRAALIVLAPLLVAALTVIAMSAAMNRWVLRWFVRLRDTAQEFALGRYAPAAMEGAPTEIFTLSQAFDAAVEQARARERDLAAALATNVSLARELHHRVKNNLQVLSSLISRQQRRAETAPIREALSEARARMAPVALAYRFIDPPDDRVAIDINAYLGELTRQLHVALGGVARGITLDFQADASPMPIDDAVNLGLVVSEAFVSGYSAAARGATARLSCLSRADGSRLVSVGVSPADPAAVHRVDEELARELTRQLHGEISFENGGVTVTLQAR